MRARILASWVAAAVLLAVAAAGAPRQIFVTSVSGNGNLSTWPDAGGNTGLAAGDAICQARAAAAGLPNAAGYRAWLSSTLDDAYCRVHGLSGKKAANCGQPSLPAAAGPWLRRDSLPFGEEIGQLLAPTGKVFYPLRFDEFGAPTTARTWTGTNQSGEVQTPNCSDWASDGGAENGRVGSTERTSGGWSGTGSNGCNDPSTRLHCIEVGVGDPLPRIVGWGRLAFVSSALGTGELGSWPQAGGAVGVAAGDAICRNLATAASLPNASTFEAWLSDSAVDARDRFVHDGPWMRLDRVQIATGIADLTDGSLVSALNLTETGGYRTNFNVWTGTAVAGTADPDRCDDWTDGTAGFNGRGGTAYAADASWTAVFTSTCDSASSPIYCLQDLPLVFGDGFESGNTAVWSSTAP